MSEPINPYQSPQADDSLTEPIPAETAQRQAVLCHVTEDDLLAWGKRFVGLNQLFRKARLRVAIYWMILVLFSLLFFGVVLDAWLIAFTFTTPILLIGIVLVLFQPALQRRAAVRNIRRLYRQGNGHQLLGDMRFEITPTALSRETRYGQSLNYWQGIESIDPGDEHLFVVLSPGSAYVIPYRDFQDTQHRDAFLAACQRYHAQAQDQEVPLPSWARSK